MTQYVNKRENILEKKLIVLCSQTVNSPEGSKQINDIIKQQINWDYILMIAGRNGVLSLVSWNLLQRHIEVLPLYVKDKLSRFFQEHTQNNLYLTSKLIEIVKLLDKNGIEILPFKGTTLAVRAYKNLSLRQYGDLDILVQPKDFDQATKILTKNGYTATSEANWLQRKALFFTHRKDIVLVSDDQQVKIELHWKLSGSHFSLPVEISQLWNRSQKMNLGGTEVNILPFNDLFIYLCLHGSRHEWERLSWICDLHELVLSQDGLPNKHDWKVVQNDARKLGCERVLELGLYLVYYFFNVKVDYPDFEVFEKNKNYLEIAEQIEKRIFSLTASTSLKAEKYSFLLSLQEKRTHRAKLYLVYLTYYLQLLFTPNPLDKSIFHLPSALYPLYFILRPVRLFFTYFSPNKLRKAEKKKGKSIVESPTRH